MRALRIASRWNSGRPYTDSASRSGHACGILYHFSNSATSRMRKSAARSMIFTPASTSSRACAIATPCGVAKNTTSHDLRSVASGAVNESAS